MQNQTMKSQTSVEMKGRTTAIALRAAVREACMSGVLATGLLVGPLAYGADTQPAMSTAGVANAIAFDIPAQSLETALLRFSEQASMQVVVANGVAHGAMSPQVKGEFSAAEALQRLLKESALTYEVTDERTIAIRAAKKGARIETISHSLNTGLAQRDASVQEDVHAGERSPWESRTTTEQRLAVEEILVTGSHIRGAQNLSSPVITFNREDIEAGGYATTQQLLQSLPQNSSTISDMTAGNFNNGVVGPTYSGSGVNLRGIGPESTLVLLNGRRMAPAGQGNFVDISMIPLSAVERVDVLTDGASAIYGSDAVGGVVNFVLREDFNGAETRLRYGTVTEGSHDELQAGQMFGHAWDSGHALLNYEYFRRTPLEGADRDFVDPVGSYAELPLIPGQKRQSALASINQRLSERIEFSADVFFSDRQSVYENAYDFGDSGFSIRTRSDMQQSGASAALSAELAGGWEARFSTLIDRSDAKEAAHYTHNGELYTEVDNESEVWSADLAADGPIGRAPGGEMRVALGAHFRKEDFVDGFNSNGLRLDRDISAVYAEVQVPWVGAQNSRTGMQRLELTLAGRFEEYSDFGSTFNPKIGVSWAPTDELNVRGTWGTSFKAPLLSQLNTEGNYAFVYPRGWFADVTGDTTPAVFVLGNGGSNLGPEESTNYTVGFDWSPTALPGFDLSVTYFDIKYDERIRTPFAVGYNWFGVLLDPTYAAVVTRYPEEGVVTELLSGLREVTCVPPGDPCPAPEEITAIVDNRLRNLASVRLSGVDFNLQYGLESRLGSWGFSLGGQYSRNNREQLVPGVPATNMMNNVWSPVDLRLRNSLSFTRGAFNVVTFVNYTDSYRDRRAESLSGPLARPEVASLTTVDVTFHLDLSNHLARAGLSKATLALSASNLFDRDPPYVGSAYGLYFDGVNANPLGRFVSAQITAQW